MRMLVIEDELKLGDYFRNGLSESGFTVDMARTGIEGRELAISGDYDAPVLDVMLPGIDGFAGLAVLRRALLRRGQLQDVTHYALRGLALDLVAREATRNGQRLELTAKELALLALLIRRQGQVLPRTVLTEQVWDINFDSETNVVDVAVRRLRSKIDDGFDEKLLHTVRGMGYVLGSRRTIAS
ncbi:winged helix-turn-helix domain-containing protein [Variovorax sp. JS1663]|uniref:winged helix-turn-helix domain-containing protein n=1 Tax=Variovorax sp. JS1663 TaxID=1851577 RepID=UPI000B342211|nr:winged helix-turn-helix domain-containing protein [Variovorax sp. JS1663]OUM00073.1 DNA-binding response regulator [Variovorax sp. JS1663]